MYVRENTKMGWGMGIVRQANNIRESKIYIGMDRDKRVVYDKQY